MKSDIILSGVGGQGIITIAAIIGTAALQNNLYIKQSEVHGMSQRGGAVQAHLRVSDNPVASDLVPYGAADIILSVEPMEGLRYLQYLSPGGWLVTNINPFVNIDNYPPMEKLISEIESQKQNIALNADGMAKEIKSPQSSNVIMLGAATPFIDLEFSKFEIAIEAYFSRKGEAVIAANLNALKIGRQFTLNKLGNL